MYMFACTNTNVHTHIQTLVTTCLVILNITMSFPNKTLLAALICDFLLTNIGDTMSQSKPLSHAGIYSNTYRRILNFQPIRLWGIKIKETKDITDKIIEFIMYQVKIPN